MTVKEVLNERKKTLFLWNPVWAGDNNYKLHLAYYFPKEKEEDIHKALLRFKDGAPNAMRCWTSLFVEQLTLLKENKLISQIDVMLRCLGSSETEYQEGKPLCALLDSAAKVYGSITPKKLIWKTRTTKKMAFLSTVREREAEIAGVFQIRPDQANLNNKVVAILDDIRTSGTTSSEIIRLIKENYQSKAILVISLGQTNHDTSEEHLQVNSNILEALKRFL